MAIFKSFQTVLIFVVIPLIFLVVNNKITLTTALDLIVWYLAISFGVFIFKTPYRLYWAVKDKIQFLKDRKEFMDKDSYDVKYQELYMLEWKMFLVSIFSPILALFAWYGLEVFCRAYTLDSLSQLLHPYYIIVAGVVTSYQPISHFLENVSNRINGVYLEGNQYVGNNDFRLSNSGSRILKGYKSPNRDRSDSTSSSPPLHIDENLLKNFVTNQTKQSETLVNTELVQIRHEFANHLKALNNDLALLKRDVRDYIKKKDKENVSTEERILQLENQIELFQMVLEKDKEKSQTLFGLLKSPYKILQFQK
ncbi:hypothetical protein DLAC_08530 [Tieghemostelium lacteum]|uniref:Transmembrane protein n=1 Tax=Tieghemostelium lacteum TaxID=361077 RepID=A0A151Z7L9_TIELA|nr:hypothetical protein DLAC_08530 [Tieghemostelium lacteum]|eukprot:KYQ89959.1 hypothetical protein DLAC_08530 [Tieghemostelium lacteum]